MAGNLMAMGGRVNSNVCEYCVDTEAEVAMLPTLNKDASGTFANDPCFRIRPPIGSTCIVGCGSGVKVFMLFSEGWVEI